jgi:hypothetical protein
MRTRQGPIQRSFKDPTKPRTSPIQEHGKRINKDQGIDHLMIWKQAWTTVDIDKVNKRTSKKIIRNWARKI